MKEHEIPQDKIPQVYDELVEGIRKYGKEHGFSKAVIGISGGIDSAVTCSLAVDAFGADNVLGVFMPSPHSSEESRKYAEMLAINLGIELKIVPLEEIYDSYLKALKKDLEIEENGEVHVYLQNIQARIRGNMLMAFSNKFGYLVLTTGNKSEAMVGYCTLYGDTAGGLAVVSDVYKTGVYQLADHINRDRCMIPREIIDRAPTAELKPGQKDQDSLPPYDVLDGILYYFLEKGYSDKEIEEKGHDRQTIKWVKDEMKKSEYKRKQCPEGIKIYKKILE